MACSSIKKRIAQAEGKILKGVKVGKFKQRLMGYKSRRREEIRQGIKFVYDKGQHKYITIQGVD